MNQSPDVSSERGPLEPASAKTNYYSSGTWDEFFFNHQRNDIMLPVEKAILKVQQLRNLASSTHSRAEAEAAIAAASKLILENQLSEEELRIKEGSNAEPIDMSEDNIIYESGRITPWKYYLCLGLAEFQGCYALNCHVRGGKSHRKINRIRLIGRKSDVVVALFMMEYITSEIDRLVNIYQPAIQRGVSVERLSFCLGAAQGIISKMNEEKRVIMKTATSTALVHLGNRVENAEQAFKDKNPHMRIGRSSYQSKAQVSTDHHKMGFEQGKKIQMNKGLPE